MYVVTGGTGRLGKHLVRELLGRGEKVKLLVRSHAEPVPEGVSLQMGDITRPDSLQGLAGKDDVVFHLAGVIDERLSDADFYNVNVIGTTNVLQACWTKDIAMLVQVSSVSVFGYPPGMPVDERCLKKPVSKYGRSKMLAEETVARRWRRIPATIIRPGMIYGPGFDEGYVPVLGMLEKGRMPIIGNGKNRVPLVHVSDVVRALLEAAGNDEALRQDFNVTGPGYPTQKELLGIASRELGVRAPGFSIPIWAAKLALPILSSLGKAKISAQNLEQLTMDRAFDNAKIRKRLGFKPKVGVSQGIKEMVEYYRKGKGG